MNWQEDDVHDGRGNNPEPWRPRRTKFRLSDEHPREGVNRDKRSGKRFHCQKSVKDDFWSDHDR
jgi:hypothetical protein